MPIRNPFARRPVTAVHDENSRPGSAAGSMKEGGGSGGSPGFERVDTVGSKASSALSIRSRRSQDTEEYKMSVVNDSGIYLPPSPIEKEATWPRRYLSRTSSDRSSVNNGDIEHFPISRESFDSYRRSFDVSARSYITDPAPRQSLDSTARFPRMVTHHHHLLHTRSSLLGQREPPTPEEGFEEVGLNDDSKTTSTQQLQQSKQDHQTGQQQQHKKKGFFSKFGSEHHDPSEGGHVSASTATTTHTTGNTTWSFIPGVGSRKRGQSGQGAELGAIPFPVDRSATGTPPAGKNAVEVDA